MSDEKRTNPTSQIHYLKITVSVEVFALAATEDKPGHWVARSQSLGLQAEADAPESALALLKDFIVDQENLVGKNNVTKYVSKAKDEVNTVEASDEDGEQPGDQDGDTSDSGEEAGSQTGDQAKLGADPVELTFTLENVTKVNKPELIGFVNECVEKGLVLTNPDEKLEDMTKAQLQELLVQVLEREEELNKED